MKTHFLQRRTHDTSDRLVANIQPRVVDDYRSDQPLPPAVDFSHVDLFSHAPQRGPVQAKLTVGAPNDVYEQEADRVAEQVVSMPDTATKPSVQRQEGKDEELQAKPLAATISPLVQRELTSDADDEDLQAKPIQRQEGEDEELQTKSLVQRELDGDSDDEDLQAKRIQREADADDEDDSDLQMKSTGAAVQRRGDDPIAAPDRLAARLESNKSGGSPLPDDVRAFMEPRFGADFSQVRVHSGEESVQMNRELNAQAFTHGQNVYFGAGKAPANDELTAHELTHVVQQTGAAAVQKQKQPIVAGKLIQAKMQGSSEVLQAVGGGGVKWGRIKQQVADYENAEAAQESRLKGVMSLKLKAKAKQDYIIAKKAEGQRKYPNAKKVDIPDQFYKDYQDALAIVNLADQKIGAEFHKLTTRLTGLEKDIGVWLNRKSKRRNLEQQKAQADDFIVQQRQTLEMLLQRVRAERADLQTRKASNEIGFDRKNVSEVKYEAVGGALNKLDAVKTSTGFEGYFKAEKAIDTEYKKLDQMSGEMELGHPGAESGIPEQNPNFGGRAVAMYRLDQLLGSNVIVKTEFATKVISPGGAPPRAEFGIVMEKAKGSGVSKSIKEEGLIQNVDDAALQRGLSKLQLLDALAGQVDRHQGNYYIQRDASGKVIGVKGIDNDLAFGVGITPEAMTDERQQIGQYRGMPPVVDKEMALRIINVAPEDVRSALTGLLSEAEVAATLARLTALQAELRKLEANGLLKSENEWGAATLADMNTGGDKQGGYYAQIKGYSEIAFREMCQISLGKAYETTKHPNISKALTSQEFKAVGDKLKQDVMNGVLDPSQVQKVIDMAIRQMVNAPALPLLSAIDFALSSIHLLNRVQ